MNPRFLDPAGGPFVLVHPHKPRTLRGLEHPDLRPRPDPSKPQHEQRKALRQAKAQSWNGATRLRAMPLRDALQRTWNTDAHVFPYCLADREDGAVLARSPRVNIHGEAVAKSRGYELRWGSVWFDVDDHRDGADIARFAADMVRRAADALHLQPTWYQGRGGVRLVFPLERPVVASEYKALWRALGSRMEANGVILDWKTKDQSRCYRLPFVQRDGSALRFPAFFDGDDLGDEFASELIRTQLEKDRKRENARREKARLRPSQAGSFSGLPELFRASGMVLRELGTHKIAVRCPWEHAHSLPQGPRDTGTVLLRQEDGGWIWHCSHNHCNGRGHRDLEEYFGASWDMDVRRRAPPRAATLPGKAPGKDIAHCRREVQAEFREVVEGDHCFIIPTGIGKSYAGIRWALRRAQATQRTVVYAVPTRELRDEVVRRSIEARKELDAEVWIGRSLSREPGVCEWPTEVTEAFRVGGTEAAKAYCNDCISRHGCSFYQQFESERFVQRARLVVCTHAMLYLRSAALDDELAGIIIDECPLGNALEPPVSCSAQGLMTAIGCGALELPDDAITSLSTLMLPGKKAGPREVADALGRKIRVEEWRLVDLALTVLSSHDQHNVRAALADLPSLEWLAALERAARGDWAGCFIQDGRLHVPRRPAFLPAADARLYLDATACPTIAEAVLPGCTVHRISGPSTLEHVSVTRFAWSAGRRNIERRPELWAAVHRFYDSPETVHWTHKSLLDSDSVGQLHRWFDDCSGRVDYFGSPRSAGYDGDKERRTVVIDSWFVPTAAIRSMAAVLARRGIGERAATNAAQRQLEWRMIEQIVGRLRILNRTDPIDVVLLGTSPHPSEQLPRDELLGDPGDALWESYGCLVSRPERKGCRPLFRDRLLREGFVVLDVDRLEPEPYVDDSAERQLRTSSLSHLLARDYPDRHLLAEDLERDLGQPVFFLEWRACTDTAVRRGAILSLDPAVTEHEDFAVALGESSGAWWVEVDGRRYSTANHPVARAARAGCRTAADCATFLGVTPRAVYVSLKKAGLAPSQIGDLAGLPLPDDAGGTIETRRSRAGFSTHLLEAALDASVPRGP